MRQIIKINSSNLETSLVKDLLMNCAKEYCTIWREPPWNEDFWKEDEVYKTMIEEIKKPLGECILYYQEETGKVMAFTWGYQIDEISAKNIFDSDDVVNFIANKKAFYIDELGVGSNFRKQGIALKISFEIMKDIINDKFDMIFLRTDLDALPAVNLYKKLGLEDSKIRDPKYPNRSYFFKNLK